MSLFNNNQPPLPPFDPAKAKANRQRRQQGLPPIPAATNKGNGWTRGQIAHDHSNEAKAAQSAAATRANLERINHESQDHWMQAYGEARKRIAGLLTRKDAMPLFTIFDFDDAVQEQQERFIFDIVLRMTSVLQKAEVTVNFKAHEWFGAENDSEGYTQMFERHQTILGGGNVLHVAKTTQSGDPCLRATVEEQKLTLMNPINQRGPLNLIANAANRFGQTGGMVNNATLDVWVPGNAHFNGLTRPRYAALNYTKDRNGACAADGNTYGYSVLVWKDHLKQNASFCAGDSFDPSVTRESICVYNTMTALLAYVHEDILWDLYEMIVKKKQIKPLSANYIECHSFHPMLFKGNLDHIRVSPQEIVQSKRSLRSPVSVMEHNLEIFCKKNGCHWLKAAF